MDKERAQYQAALQLDPDLLPAHVYIGHNYLDNGDWEKALHHYQRVLQDEPHHSEALFNTGLALRSQGRTMLENDAWKAYLNDYDRGERANQAVEFLNKAAFLAPNASIFYFKGLAEKEVLGRKKDALISFQKAIDADAYQVKFRIALIEALLGMGLKTRAQKTLEEALGIFPGDQELQNLRSSYFPEDEPSKGLKSIFSVFRGKK